MKNPAFGGVFRQVETGCDSIVTMRFLILGFWLFISACPAMAQGGILDSWEETLRSEKNDIETPQWGGGDIHLHDLERIMRHLHDIRNHEAFFDVGKRWQNKGEKFQVLYLASGTHLAPLALLESMESVSSAHFIYTEIDPASLEIMAEALSDLQRQRAITGLSMGFRLEGKEEYFLRLSEMAGQGFAAAGLRGITGKLPLSPSGWVGEYRFQYRDKSVLLELVIAGENRAGLLVPFYRPADLMSADLIITHDWDSAPQKNLGLLYTLLEARLQDERGKPLRILMEDLQRHPFPVELSMFTPVARSRQPFGHCEFLLFPDGKKSEWESGASIYKGAILLEPDLGFWKNFDEAERKTIFNFLIFSKFLFNRRNVNVIAGKCVTAPALLDVGAGFGLMDIAGEKIRRDSDFLPELAEKALALAGKFENTPYEHQWKRMLKRFEKAMKKEIRKNVSKMFEDESVDHPFVTDVTQRTFYLRLLANKDKWQTQKALEQKQCREALEVMVDSE